MLEWYVGGVLRLAPFFPCHSTLLFIDSIYLHFVVTDYYL